MSLSQLHQSRSQTFSASKVQKRLAVLDPSVPWTHHFEIAGVETITPDIDEKFYKKSIAAKGLGNLALHYHRIFSEGRPLSETRVLDVASAEGGLSVAFAQAGAKEVLGIEGRRIYVDRANFVAEAMGLSNFSTMQGDVRAISKQTHGQFDFTINSGILHHLGQPDFLPFLQSMADVTKDAMFLYTHVSTPAAVSDFRLKGPVKAAEEYEGYLLQEHPENASPEEREAQVRASLDNTYSFWATEESLIAALKKVGFKTIVKMFEPHVFGGYVNRNLRVVLLCKKT
jgi:2-polyprenyl-3-methyl-5-hydroxy-6-metoxy-1,4-benzoquinol methylase